MPIAEDIRAELQSLLASARAQLEVEEELGGPGIAWVPSARQERAPTAVAAAAAPLPTPAISVAAPTAAPAPSLPVVQAPKPASPLTSAERITRLQLLAADAASCTACVLHEGRTKSVFARGSVDSPLVFVGEGPGRDEDQQGQPFVGAAGQLLDKMVTAMGFARDEVYICNVVKCRPPENRTPRPEESLACRRHLVPQLEVIAPQVIVALGRCAAQALGTAEAMGPWRGLWSSWEGIPVMSTYHPAFLLRSPEFKRTVWEDLQLVMQRLGKSPPKRA